MLNEVYVVQFRTGLVKIGRAGSAWSRMTALETHYGKIERWTRCVVAREDASYVEAEMLRWARTHALLWNGFEAFACSSFPQFARRLHRLCGAMLAPSCGQFNPLVKPAIGRCYVRNMAGRSVRRPKRIYRDEVLK